MEQREGTMDQHGRQRVVIEGVKPEVDGGRFPAKRAVGEEVVVEADLLADGHDELSARLLYRREQDRTWTEAPMTFLVNDRWRGTFRVTEIGRYRFTVTAWVDHFRTWRRDLVKRTEAGQDVAVDLLAGARLIDAAVKRAAAPDTERLREWAGAVADEKEPQAARVRLALSAQVVALMDAYPDRGHAATYEREPVIDVEREKARFSTWYELFPRSCALEPGGHATFKDCEAWLPYVASMGFDVLYLPPIHPIGLTNRKGKNNATSAAAGDPGSPWAIGSREGGHDAIHPQLGTLEDFKRLVAKAGEHGLEVAMDLAFQCSPDHPYAREHHEWFRIRPDGTIQYAENPPKKYQDIYPLDFENDHWRELWEELKRVVLHWTAQGIRIFRVDNPHTKSFSFWEWLIREVRREHPDVIFLAEAFTRPKVMYRLAKLGFAQSYTYFAWRNTKAELTQYFTELTRTDVRDFFRPNLWPNTPDILTEQLQHGGRPAFLSRLVLAATLGASYGIYGPAFELCERRPREAGSEEYLDSEKYEIRRWAIDRADSLKELIGRVNRIRRDNPALQSDHSLRFHAVDNDQLLCYSKRTADGANVILVVVNLSPHYTHSGWIDLDLGELGIVDDRPYQMHDLLTDAYYLWQGPRNYVQIDPHSTPAHIFRLRRRLHTEQDFDYYL